MNTLISCLRTSLFVFAASLCFASSSFAQGEASGGRTPAKPNETKPANKTPGAPKQSGALDRIDGKWLTTGNDFGVSEVVFTQNGANVSGVIKWADGRTGTINGTLVGKRLKHTWSDSTGNGGSGWLELSWYNFLGGPWHNQRVKDGSWTLERLEGQWCFGGDRSRVRKVTHDEQGRITILADDGTQENGHYDGWLFLDQNGQSIKGVTEYRARRINFENGTFWTWCGRL